MIENAFQYFYIEFMGLLLDIHNNCSDATPEELSFAKTTLYKGDIYRYLGSSDCFKPTKGIIPVKYNHIYVSWSKESKLNHNMDEKLYGDKTLLIGNTGKEYGIDLQDLGGRPFEKEIVFPTPKAAVKKIKLIK